MKENIVREEYENLGFIFNVVLIFFHEKTDSTSFKPNF